MESSRETMWLQCGARSKPTTSGRWTLGEGNGLSGHHAVSPRGGIHMHNYFSFFLSCLPLFSLGVRTGLTVKGQEKWEMQEGKPISPLNKNKTNEREQRVIFAPQKMEIQGRLGGQWMETSKLLRRRQPTVIGSLRPPIGWEKPPAPSAARGGVSLHAGCSNSGSASRPLGARNSSPEPRLRA